MVLKLDSYSEIEFKKKKTHTYICLLKFKQNRGGKLDLNFCGISSSMLYINKIYSYAQRNRVAENIFI